MNEAGNLAGMSLEDAKEYVGKLIENECGRYLTCEQVRQSFVTMVSQVRAMKISVDRNVLDTLSGKVEVTTQLLGKRVFDEVEKVIDRYPILRAVVEGNVDLASMIGEAEVVEVRKNKVQTSRITQNEINEFKDLCDVECDMVVDFLEDFRGSGANTEQGILDMEMRLFSGMGQHGFKTFILRGGLHECGKLDRNVVLEFNEAADKIRVHLENGTPEGNAHARGWTTKLEELKLEYYREIWQLEDEVGPRGYIRGSAIPTLRKQLKREITRLSSKEEAEEVSDQIEDSFADRVEQIRGMVARKWRERKILASKVMKEQEKSGVKDGRLSAQEEGGKKSVLVNGYIELSNEVVMKIQESVNYEIRGELNRQVLEKARGVEYYSSLDRRYLPGVMMIMKEKYQNAPIHMMFDSLEELFTGNISNADAGRVNDWMDAKILLWAEFNFLNILFRIYCLHL